MTKASNAEPRPLSDQSACHLLDDKYPAGGARSLWLWVAAGFLFLAILWTAMFTAARSADTRTVPLAAKGGRP